MGEEKRGRPLTGGGAQVKKNAWGGGLQRRHDRRWKRGLFTQKTKSRTGGGKGGTEKRSLVGYAVNTLEQRRKGPLGGNIDSSKEKTEACNMKKPGGSACCKVD